MATIRNSIGLQDRMSSVLKDLVRNITATDSAMGRLDSATQSYAKSSLRNMKTMHMQTKGMRERYEKQVEYSNLRHLQRLEELERQHNFKMKQLQYSSNKGGRSGGLGSIGGGVNLLNLSAALYLLNSIKSTLSNIMAIPDTGRAISYRLETYDNTGVSGKQLYSDVYKTAMDSRSDLESTGNLASRILISGATGGSGYEAIKLAGIMNKASFLGGSSSDESRRALLQLSQSLASGVMQGDELRAIREQAPGLTYVLSKGLAKIDPKFVGTTAGDLKRLGAEGELTADRVIKAFQAMDSEVSKQFLDSPKQFGQAMTQIGNVWKYFLTLLSDADGAFGKITQKAWEFADFLESTDGKTMLSQVAGALSGIVDIALNGLTVAGNIIKWLSQNTNVLVAAFVALGVVAVAAGTEAAIAWIAATWPILLVALAVGLVVYALLECGITAQQIVGSIAGGFGFLALVIYDLVVWIVAITAIALGEWYNAWVNAITGVVWVLLWFAQLFSWLVAIIWNAFNFVLDAMLIQGKLTFGSLYIAFAGLTYGILGFLNLIAKGIDAVFKSKLSSSIEGWMKGIPSSIQNVYKGMVKPGGLPYADLGKQGVWTFTDEISDKVNWWQSKKADTWSIPGWAASNTLNPLDGWKNGYASGSKLVDSFSKFDFSSGASKFDDMQKKLEALQKGTTIGGGKLDSVGKIDSDVTISDQDIQLLKDIAAREFLVNMTSVTPRANIKFGDVRETADVNKIMEVIADMVEEHFASSLIIQEGGN